MTLAAAVVAVLELDTASIGPFLLSRPFVVGPLVGWFHADVWSGALIGVLFETATLIDLPLGGCLRFSAGVAAGTAAWLAGGPGRLPIEAAAVVGIAAGLIHATAEHRWRVARGGLARRAETLLDSGGSPNLGLVLTEALALQAATTFVVVFATAWFGERLMGTLWRHLPPFASAGARSTLCAAPWAGAGAVTGALWRRS